MTLVACLVAVAAAILLIPASVFFVECAASVFLRDSTSSPRPAGVSLVVLIPAHDEREGIAGTVVDVRTQLEASDRIVVVADNCADDTAEIFHQRAAKISLHEVGHLLGLGHCWSGLCVMHFSSNLQSLDALPISFCSACEYEVKRRLRAILANGI